MSRSLHAAIAALVLLPPVAAAQQSQDTAHVAPMVVTATRTPLRIDQSPASVTVLTAAELRAQGIVHLTDALRSVPGLTVVQSGSHGSPASVFVRGGQSNYTKVLIDGMPANEPGGAFDFGTLSLDDVERIEIVRGPASVVWGSDAVSAVVHVITRRGAGEGGSVAARGGTYGTFDVTGSAEGGAGPLRGAVTAARHLSSGSYPFNSDYRNALVGGSGTWSGAAGSLRVGGRHATVTAHFPTDFTGAPVDPNSYRKEERTTASAELTRAAGPATVSLLAGHSLVNASSIDPANEEHGTSTSFDTRSRRQQVELRADAPLTTWLTAAAGGIAEWQRRTGASNTTTTSASAPTVHDRQANAGERANRGAYAELLLGMRGTTATIGGRFDHSATYGDFATYRLAATHLLPTATRVRASVGTAFREPSFDETLPSAFSTGNADIRPERTSSWEAGVEQHLAAGRVVIGATYFAQRFVDMIDYFADAYPGRYENVAAARARGTELELRLAPARGWSVDGGITLLNTKVETAGYGGSLAEGRALLRRPERTATAGITRTGGRGTVAARLAHTGERQDVRFFHDAPWAEEETLPAYSRLDLSGELPVSVRRAGAVAVTLRVENALGASYETASGFAAPGRVILAGLRAGF